MSLQEKLDGFKAQFKTQAPAEAFEAFGRSTQELIDSGQAERALQAGDQVPDFVLTDSDRNDVALKDLLAKGPVVLTFYRGVWCPYCNIELQALEEVAEEIRARGATLVAISMQGASDSRKSQKDNNLSFPILTDKAGELANKFGIRWTLQDYVIPIHEASAFICRASMVTVNGICQCLLAMLSIRTARLPTPKSTLTTLVVLSRQTCSLFSTNCVPRLPHNSS
ncbi:MAG: peroxiredoxin family protein [Pseudomonadota bacterium]